MPNNSAEKTGKVLTTAPPNPSQPLPTALRAPSREASLKANAADATITTAAVPALGVTAQPTTLHTPAASAKEEVAVDKSGKRRRAGAVKNQMNSNKLIPIGTVLLNRYLVVEIIGGGGFAQIYKAMDQTLNIECAVKVEDSTQDIRRMKLEITVLLALRGNLGIPEIMGMGKFDKAHFIVMQLVGKNLSDVRRRLPNKCISSRSLYRTMIQIVRALSIIHGAGFLHRDIKPSNCCVGHTDVTRIYLVDYGLTRQYLDKGGIVRKPRVGVGLRGTIRYMSLDAHARRDLGPNNDLVAILYTTIELGDGSLPWTRERNQEDIIKLKQSFVGEKLCAKQPKMSKVAEYIESLNYHSIPDYDKLFAMLEDCNPPDLTPNEPYDWQKNKLSTESHVNTTKEDLLPTQNQRDEVNNPTPA